MKYYFYLKQFLFYYTLKYNLFLLCKAEFSSAITPVFSHMILQKSFWFIINMLIYHQSWKQLSVLNIFFVEPVILSSGFFDE